MHKTISQYQFTIYNKKVVTSSKMNIEQLICSICLAAQQNPLKLEQCIHSFCTDCISQWLDIKNNCPLCLNLIGHKPHNKLLIKPPEEVQFDNSALVFEHEIKSIDETMKNLQKRITKKHQESKNLKSHFPKSSLNYISDQMLVAKNYYSLLQETILMGDTVNTSLYMQLTTEVLLDIESVLQGGPIGKMHDDYDQCYSSSSESDYSEDELEDYLHAKTTRREKARLKKINGGSANGNTTGNNKSGKVIKL